MNTTDKQGRAEEQPTRVQCEELRARIQRLGPWARTRLTNRLRKVARDGSAKGLLSLRASLQREERDLHARQTNIPQIIRRPDLPITAHWDEISRLIEDHQVSIVCGETGSGKTTQLPKICLELGRGVAGLIGHTQPRRVAASSVAHRIADELHVGLGEQVAYKVRFGGQVGPRTLVKLMTDGILLAELKHDRLLRRYDTLIIDEAHERSLNIDFLLGYIKTILPQRPELRIIITSATINPEQFSQHFDAAPIIRLDGKLWPVDIEYHAPDEDEEDTESLTARVVNSVRAMLDRTGKDILVFMTGERDIRECDLALAKQGLDVEVIQLYGRMDLEAQRLAFFPNPQRRRVILATNVAETSVTLPNIGGVIDLGTARLSRYNTRRRIQSLRIESISKASATQRAGRSGRTGPGLCFRLYSLEDFDRRADYTDPEVRRTNLAQIILRLKDLSLGEIEDFPFVDPPESRHINDGIALLRELNALDAHGELTALGKKLARVPVDARIGAMIVAAHKCGSLREVLVIAAACSIRDPFDVPSDQRARAKRAREKLSHRRSDFLTYVVFWRLLHKGGKQPSFARLRKICQKYVVPLARVREWQEVHHQLSNVARSMGLSGQKHDASYAAIHKALLCGCLGQFGCLGEAGEYLAPKGSAFRLSSATALHGRGVSWVCTTEIIETTKLFVHRAAMIRAEWIEAAAPEHLLMHSYSNPRYSTKSGFVEADVAVSLYGVRLLTRRCRRYDEIDAIEAHYVFVAALVEGKVDNFASFFQHNRQIVERIQLEQHKARRVDFLADDAEIVDLYCQIIPSSVTSKTQFRQWAARHSRPASNVLSFRDDQLRRQGAPCIGVEEFPDFLQVNSNQFPLSYRFEPGDRSDGITVTLPIAMLNQLAQSSFDRLVPGYLPEKVLALLRSLPKALRRRLVPMPACVERCLSRLGDAKKPLTSELGEILEQDFAVTVSSRDWHPERLPNYLHMNIRLVDAALQIVAEGRDVPGLFGRFARRARQQFECIRPRQSDRTQLTAWHFDAMPKSIEFVHGHAHLVGFPALVDKNDHVDLVLLDNEIEAAQQTDRGIMRLVNLTAHRSTRKFMQTLHELDRYELLHSSLKPSHPGQSSRNSRSLRDQIVRVAYSDCFRLGIATIRERSHFESWYGERIAQAHLLIVEIVPTVGAVLEAYHRIKQQVDKQYLPGLDESYADVGEHLQRLVFDGFVETHTLERLKDLPRYLQALEIRLEKLLHAGRKDLRKLRNIRSLGTPAMDDPLYWAIEELRVATFAQELGTANAISLDSLKARLTGAQANRDPEAKSH